MNGFELKEQIEALKKQIARNDQMFGKPVTKMMKVDKDTGVAQTPSEVPDIMGAFTAKLDLSKQLAQLEMQQEKYNVTQTVQIDDTTVITLAEAIKIRGMLAATAMQMDRMASMIDSGADQYELRSIQTTNMFLPVPLFDTNMSNSLKTWRNDLEAQVIKMKSLIAAANTTDMDPSAQKV